jgi:hypothetical protein
VAFVWRTVIVIVPGGGELDPLGADSAIFTIRNLTIDRLRTSVRPEEFDPLENADATVYLSR